MLVQCQNTTLNDGQQKQLHYQSSIIEILKHGYIFYRVEKAGLVLKITFCARQTNILTRVLCLYSHKDIQNTHLYFFVVVLEYTVQYLKRQ